MKKTILAAIFGIAGLMNANTKAEPYFVDEEDDLIMQCYSYGILVWCTNEVMDDTICWGEGTSVPTYQEAIQCQTRNAQLLTQFYCGNGGSGPQAPSFDINP